MKPSETLTQVEASNEGIPPLTGWRKTFAALRNPNYRYFYMGQTISLIGTWARSAAWGWLAYQLTRSKFILGLTFMLNSIPILFFSVYAGSLADRLPKLAIFKVTSCVALLASLTLSIILFRGSVHIGLLMSFVVLWGLTTAFEMPARQSLMVELVGKKDLVNAIALNSAMVNSTRIIGPALGGILLNSYGAAWCFLLDAVSFLAVIYSLYQIRLTATTHTRNTKVDWKYYAEGFNYIKTNPILARTVLLLSVMSLFGWAYLSQMPAFVPDRLHLAADGYGWLLSMNGLGACTAALVVAAMGGKLVKTSTLYTGIGIYAVFVFLLGFQHNPIGASFLIFFSGFGIILFFSTGNSLIQSNSPDHLRGRIMGIWALVFGGGMPLGSFWMGTLASRTNSGIAIQVGGVLCVLGASCVYWLFRKDNPGRHLKTDQG
jgi:MFS family permease